MKRSRVAIIGHGRLGRAIERGLGDSAVRPQIAAHGHRYHLFF
jgi:hypothetical protein